VTGQQAIVRHVVNRIAVDRGLAGPWPETDVTLPRWLCEALTEQDTRSWGAAELGAMRERLLSAGERKSGGIWYTPRETADFMVRFTIGAQLDRLANRDDPNSALQVLAVDPACGMGVFLVSAARLIARRYAALIFGCEPDDGMERLVMPEVMRECVFGLDIDPVAITLAKSVLWLETLGKEEITFMDRNVIVENPLSGPDAMPPALEERYPTPTEAMEAFR
jgi:hypothetical protein